MAAHICESTKKNTGHLKWEKNAPRKAPVLLSPQHPRLAHWGSEGERESWSVARAALPRWDLPLAGEKRWEGSRPPAPRLWLPRVENEGGWPWVFGGSGLHHAQRERRSIHVARSFSHTNSHMGTQPQHGCTRSPGRARLAPRASSTLGHEPRAR